MLAASAPQAETQPGVARQLHERALNASLRRVAGALTVSAREVAPSNAR
jgi:hypothetical protein